MSRLYLILPLAMYCTANAYGQFSSEQLLYRPLGYQVRSMQVVDLDGDGQLDVLVGTGRGVHWAKGDGQGGFAEAISLLASDDGIHIAAAADVDGDGDLDVVYASKNTGLAHLILNQGGAMFTAPLSISGGSDPFVALAFHDLDLDGRPDLVAARTNGIDRFMNLSGGSFGQADRIFSGTFTYPTFDVGDIDGDGYPDLVASPSSSSAVRWYRNLQDGSLSTTYVAAGSDSDIRSIRLGDVDADGDLDIFLVSFANSRVTFRVNNGTGGFGTPTTISTRSDSRSLGVGDLDGDGYADLVLGTGSEWETNFAGCYVLKNGRGGAWEEVHVLAHAGRIDLVTFADINGDSAPDVLNAGYRNGQVRWHVNDGAGGFGLSRPILDPIGLFDQVRTADLNGDGYPDFVGCSRRPDGLVVGLSNGPGSIGETYTLLQRDTLFDGSSDVVFADFDGDGDIDMLRARGSQRLDFYWNDGTGHFPLIDRRDLSGTFGAGGSAFSVGDLDGDGDIDLATPGGAGGVWFYLNDGTGANWTVQQTSNSSALASSNGIHVRDIDNDGLLDVVVHTNPGGGNGSVRRLMNNGAWSTTASHPDLVVMTGLTGSNGFISADIGDVDGDGDLDIIASEGARKNLFFSRNDGAAGFAARQVVATFPLDDYLTHAILMDVDGDGDQDIVALNVDNISWYPNDGTGAFGGGIRMHKHPVRTIFTWMEGTDFDADGDMDLVFCSTDDQSIYWLKSYVGSPYSVEGSIYLDQDGDGTMSPTEPGLPYNRMVLSPAGSAPFSSFDGHYRVQCDAGGHVLAHTMDTVLWRLTSDSSSYTVRLDPSNPVSVGNDFGFLPALDSTIARIWFNSPGVRCNDTIAPWIGLSNLGSSILRGQLRAVLNPRLRYISAAPPPVAVSGDTLFWDIADVSFFGTWMARLELAAPGFQLMGRQLSVDLGFDALDNNGAAAGEFSERWTSTVVCAYDPNIKIVDPEGFGPMGAVDIGTDLLDYTIHFQNTGNAEARNVLIMDRLSPLLDRASLRILGASHDLTGILVDPDAEVLFRFNDINLPDSTTDARGSQGFVRFSVRPVPGIAHGTVIENHAAIHFDWNPPIITDNTVTTFVDCSLFSASITQTEPGILGAPDGVGYQWFLDGTPIAGADSQTVSITGTGSYTVLVTNWYGCETMSDPYLIISTGVDAPDHAPSYLLRPVPANDEVLLSSQEVIGADHIIGMFDIHGRLVSEYRGQGGKELRLERREVPPGIYVVRVVHKDRIAGTARLIWE